MDLRRIEKKLGILNITLPICDRFQEFKVFLKTGKTDYKTLFITCPMKTNSFWENKKKSLELQFCRIASFLE